MSIAPDLKSLLPKIAAPEDDDVRPIYHLWTYDPDGNHGNGEIILDENEGKHPADHVTHKDLAPHVHHPERVDGFAYAIKDGWRITNAEHNEVPDKNIVKLVLQKLKGEFPEPPLPHVRYHRL